MSTTKYIENEFHGIHSVDDDERDQSGKTAYDRLHEVSPSGLKHLPAGWRDITEKEARTRHPQLFGAPDPIVRMNAAELRNAKALQVELEAPVLIDTLEE